MNYFEAQLGMDRDAKASDRNYSHAVAYFDSYYNRIAFSFHQGEANARKAAAGYTKKGLLDVTVLETVVVDKHVYRNTKKDNRIVEWRAALNHIIAENANGECTCYNVEYHDRHTQQILLELARLGVDTKTIAL